MSDLDKGRRAVDLFVDYFVRRLETAAQGNTEMPAAELEVCRKLLQDNAITMASVRKGDFGDAARVAAEEFPFDDDGKVIGRIVGANPSRAN
jgi:hypothetical protein